MATALSNCWHHSRAMPPERHCEANTARTNEPRNGRFESDQPFDGDPDLSLLGATGAFRNLDPTSAQYSWSGWREAHHHPSADSQSYGLGDVSSDERRQQYWGEDEGTSEGHFPARRKDDVLAFLWRSRDNRKGRHALLLRRGKDGQKQPQGTLEPTNSWPATLRGIVRLFTRFPYWDISWCVAIVYTVGSLVWVANGFFGVLPLVGRGSSQKLTPATTWSAFAGASIFFLGSYLLFLEAINANRIGCFGWAVERAMKGVRPEAEVHPGDCGHYYHAQQKHPEEAVEHEVDPQEAAEREVDNGGDDAQDSRAEGDGHDEPTENGWYHSDDQGQALATGGEEANDIPSRKWLWWPSWRDLRTIFFYQNGFLACAIQLVSGALFFLSKITTLPGITEYLPQPVIDVLNWAPQIIGCIGFILASLLFMLETQPKWHVPAPRVLGWHVGFWKLVGCIGFLISAVFGPLGQHGMLFAENQSTIASFWGSWAILLGSLVQWYESLDKYPIVEEGTSRYSEWNEKFIEDSEESRGTRGE